MSSPLQIRTAAAIDIPAIVELFGTIDDFHSAGVPYAFRGSSAVPRLAQEIEALIAGPDTTILVAELGGRVVGHLTLEIVSVADRMPFVPRAYGLVRDLVVASDTREQGVGSALMAEAERWVAGRGLDAVELTVWSFNVEAIRLYERLGYSTALLRMRRVIG